MQPYALAVDMAVRKVVTRCRAHGRFSDEPVMVLMNVADSVIDDAYNEPFPEVQVHEAQNGKAGKAI